MNTNKDIDLYSIGIIHCSVCAKASLTVEEVTEKLNKEYPTGISSKWEVTEKTFKNGQPNPCPCNDHPETRKHYLFTC